MVYKYTFYHSFYHHEDKFQTTFLDVYDPSLSASTRLKQQLGRKNLYILEELQFTQSLGTNCSIQAQYVPKSGYVWNPINYDNMLDQ